MTIGESQRFRGVVDLISMEKIIFSDILGTKVIREKLQVIL